MDNTILKTIRVEGLTQSELRAQCKAAVMKNTVVLGKEKSHR